MAKGQQTKEIITKKILETFEGSFTYDKEIRIPYKEDGELIQIKVTLTAAKTNVEPNGDVAIPGENGAAASVNKEINFGSIEPTQEEKENVARLAKMLNL